MTEPGNPDKDLAWASFQTFLTPAALLEFCQDIERLFRINPYLEFSHWESLGPDRYRFGAKNSSQDPAFEFQVEMSVEHKPDGLIVHYNQGIKKSTELIIEAVSGGSKLTINEEYRSLSEQERESHLKEVDQSLVTWARDLQSYLLMWNRWSWCGPWRWYMRRVWQPLKPMGRRIIYMFIWITIVELALIALGVAIYFAEYA